MADDIFSNRIVAASDPAQAAKLVVPSDTIDLTNVSRALYIGRTGDVSVVMVSGQSVSFTDVAAGTILPLRVQKVNASGTTASEIVALW
ncbi:hypothetical protein N9M50_04440 [Alphaproteobacteria bacterium]|nr:hypothetical protein [Alphaproteobacteria bacterium]